MGTSKERWVLFSMSIQEYTVRLFFKILLMRATDKGVVDCAEEFYDNGEIIIGITDLKNIMKEMLEESYGESS